MTPDIRPFQNSDQEAVIALSLRAWAPVFASLERVLGDSGVYRHLHPDWRAGQRRAVAAACEALDTHVWVAVTGVAEASVDGFVAVRLDEQTGIGEIHMIAVDPDCQRQGTGSVLTEFAISWLKDSGMTVAMVETGGDPGHAPARQTYEHAGFVQLPIARYFKQL